MQYLPVTAYYIFLWQDKRFDEKHKILFRNEGCNNIKCEFLSFAIDTQTTMMFCPNVRNVTISCKILLNRKYDKLKKLH